jgi:hypothetical protein
MNNAADRIEQALDNVRDKTISTALARERIEQARDEACATLRRGSDSQVALDICADGANAYLTTVEGHPDEPAFKFDAALAAVRRKAERLRKLG